MNSIKIFAETERLILRELLPTDREAMFEMDSDAEVHKYVGKSPVKAIEEIDKVIEFIRRQYIDNGIGRWAAVEKTTGEFVGWTGLKLMKETVNGHIDFYDIGYRLAKKHWGKGYATESGIAARDYAFNTLKAPAIYAMTDVDNIASKRALEKIGLKYVETFNYDAEPGWREKGELATWYKMEKPF